ncbi:MAG TPA: cyanophycin synthetase, partial [Gemmatimonadaceae bacterium]
MTLPDRRAVTIRPASDGPDSPALTLAGLRILRGLNPWCGGPAVLCELQLAADVAPDQRALLEALAAALPGLHEPLGLDGHAGLLPRLPLRTLVPLLVQHAAGELQRQAGAAPPEGRVLPGDSGAWTVLVGFDDEEIGVRSARAAVELVRAALAGAPPDAAGAVAALRTMVEARRLGPSTRAIVDAARRRGIPVRRLDDGALVQLGTGRWQRRIRASLTHGDGCIATEIAQDKALAKHLLAGVGLPTPEGTVARDEADAVAAAAALGYPVLLKPLDGNQGRGVSGRLDDAAALRAAWPCAAAISPRVVVERFTAGRDYRVLVVGDRVVACAERLPAHVVGDGTRSVRALVAAANRDPRRGDGHAAPLTRLALDADALAHLARHGRDASSVPAAGERVTLRDAANLSTGGSATDRTDALHPDNAAACVLAARAVGLEVAGVDVVSPDIAVPFAHNDAAIVEVNAAPGLRMHLDPNEGTPRDVGAAIVDHLFPPDRPHRVPVVAITGTNGKTTTTRLVAHLLRRTGATVGCATTDGVYLQEHLVTAGDMTGPVAAGMVLDNPLVDAAVLETARGGILRAGLGFDRCDVGVVLNVAADHLGLRGVHTVGQLAEVKGIVAAAVAPGGWAVLNADDRLVLGMRARTAGRVALFSTRAPGTCSAFEAQLAAGGVCARVEDEVVVLYDGTMRHALAGVAELPLTLGGAARFQLQNVLAAALAAHVQGVPVAELRTGLREFAPCPERTPGRLNLLRVGRAHVVVDYAHNAPAVAAL